MYWYSTYSVLCGLGDKCLLRWKFTVSNPSGRVNLGKQAASIGDKTPETRQTWLCAVAPVAIYNNSQQFLDIFHHRVQLRDSYYLFTR
jgi:hypothetical protein